MKKNAETDKQTTIQDLKILVAEFVKERDWAQFHSPKNLAMSIAIEAAELMEHFQWISATHPRNRQTTQEIEEELADVVCYVLAMANVMKIDVAHAVEKKMGKNRKKYPVEEFKGRFGPDDPR